jgi:hypothetical protein
MRLSFDVRGLVWLSLFRDKFSIGLNNIILISFFLEAASSSQITCSQDSKRVSKAKKSKEDQEDLKMRAKG